MADRTKIYLIILNIIIDFWVIGLFFFGYYIQQFPIDMTSRTDAIIVLTGGSNRIEEGVKLLNNNLADRLFISGVSHKVKVKDIEKKAKTAINDVSKIELGYKASDTIGNASEIAEWIRANKINSVRLITSNYHIPRSLIELKPYKLPIKIVVHPVYSDTVKKNWWESWGTFKFIISEYNKLIIAYIHNLFR